jgi:hypothetical protein
MTMFKAMSPNTQVNGQTVLSVVDGMGAFKSRAITILSEHGIDDPQPNQWYSQQAWLDAFRTISEKIGPSTLVQIGKTIPKTAAFPPEIDSIEKALAAIDIAYHMNNRGGEIGHYTYSANGSKTTAKMVCNNPFPCDFDRGIIIAMSERFAPKGSSPKVQHDDSQPCRKKGCNSCTYLISW